MAPIDGYTRDEREHVRMQTICRAGGKVSESKPILNLAAHSYLLIVR